MSHRARAVALTDVTARRPNSSVKMGTQIRHLVMQNLEALRSAFRSGDRKGTGKPPSLATLAPQTESSLSRRPIRRLSCRRWSCGAPRQWRGA